MFTYLSFADAPYMGYLPTGITHFGGDTQIFTVPPECWAAPANSIYFDPLAQQALMPPATGFYPSVDIGSVQQAGIDMANSITLRSVISTINSMLSRCGNMISGMKSRLNSMLLDEKLTDEQRKAVNDLLKRLDEQESKLRDLQSATDLEVPERGKKAEEIENALREIANDMAKVKNGEKVDGDTDKDTDIDKDKDTDIDKDKDTDTDTDTDTDDTKTKTKTKTNNSRVDNFPQEDVEAVHNFRKAVYRIGTDDSLLEAVCGSITKDNVMDRMLAWNKYHSTEKGESFMQAFMWDANNNPFNIGQGQKRKYARQIAEALREKAEELGLHDECREDFAAIDDELDSLLYISNDIAEKYDAIIKKIADKMGSKYGSPYAKGSSESKGSS